ETRASKSFSIRPTNSRNISDSLQRLFLGADPHSEKGTSRMFRKRILLLTSFLALCATLTSFALADEPSPSASASASASAPAPAAAAEPAAAAAAAPAPAPAAEPAAAAASAAPTLPAYFSGANDKAKPPVWPDPTGAGSGVWATPAGDGK